MRLESSLLQPDSGLPDGIADDCESLVTRPPVVGKDQIEIDRQARHVAHEQIDRRTTLQCEGAVHEHQRRHLRQQTRGIKISLVHGLSTSRPSADRDTQGRLLPFGSVPGSSLAAHGDEASRPSCRHSRTVLTLEQCCNSSRSTSARRL